ncbi:hypothetical protein Tco_1309270, partial [Tanacetum coccineum]
KSCKLEKDVYELKNVNLSTEALATLKSQVPNVVDDYLGSKLGDALQKTLQKHSKSASEILKIKREQDEKQKMPKYTIKSTYKAALKENPANHKLYYALMEALIEDENAMDKGVADTGKKTKRRRTKKSESSKKPSTTKETHKDKATSKGSKTSKSASAKEPIEEPIAEVVMDDAGEDVVRDDDHPQDTSEPKTSKTLNQDWFKQPPRSPTPDLEWNKRQVVLGDRYPFDLSKPLPLQGHPGHQTIVVDYFFNNDLEYLKSSDPERTYTTSITKTKATRYEIVGIKDMVLTLWCPTKIVVKRANQQLYKFKEGDFVDLYLNDIEDMLLLKSRHQKACRGLQLGVESYQKKFNITAPQKTFPEIDFKDLYTLSYNPPGVIYEDLNKMKRAMRANELYKFSDGTLKKV